MANELTQDEAKTKLIELIKDARICMLTTIDEDGNLQSRPMGLQEAEFDGDLWFFTDNSSPKANQIRRNSRVGVTINNKNDSWVSMSGTAQLVDDRQKARELWNPLLKAWFPNGVEDEALTLIKVTAESAEYWDSPSSKVITLLSMVKGEVTGKPADPGENETVDLQQ